MIRVRTVDREQLQSNCGRLWDTVHRDYRPNLVIGVRSGGWWIAEAMRAARQSNAVPFLPLTCRRPSSEAKGRSRAFQALLRALPYPVLNAMRLAEYYLITLPRCRAARRAGPGVARVPDPAELEAIRAAIVGLRAPVHLLIVDDSLDSGATLANVVQVLRAMLPAGSEVRTALFTVLGPDPIIAADFWLYRRINFRFPWSYDFHG